MLIVFVLLLRMLLSVCGILCVSCVVSDVCYCLFVCLVVCVVSLSLVVCLCLLFLMMLWCVFD